MPPGTAVRSDRDRPVQDAAGEAFADGIPAQQDDGVAPPSGAAAIPHAVRGTNPEEIQRIRVDDEDRMAFRVGVNILTLALIALGVWLIWRNWFSGG